jgi:hypothetical protein
MNTVDKYLTFVSLPQLIGAFLAALVLIRIVPGRLRLATSLALLVVVLCISIMMSLGTAVAVAKGSINGALALVAVSALMDPGPRRQLPKILWIYPVLAALSFFYVLQVQDAMHAWIIRLQWFMMSLTALLVLRVATSQETLMPILRGLAVGGALSVLFAFTALIIQPRESFLEFRRFTPYGGNPLQSGLVFALSLPLFLYFAVRGATAATRAIWLGLGLLTACMVVIGVSRSIIAISILCTLPLLWGLRRRPLLVAVGIILLLSSIGWFVGKQGGVGFERLLSLQDQRWSLLGSYADIITQRPFFGLAFTRDMNAGVDTSMRTYSHNAYLSVLYLGGFSYFLPLFAMLVYSLWSAVRVFRARRLMDFDPLLLSMLLCMLLAMYLHGFTDIQLYYPGFAWTWMQLFVSSLFITLAREIPARQQAAALGEMYFDEPPVDAMAETYDYPVPQYQQQWAEHF